jgi:hypothetical protein
MDITEIGWEDVKGVIWLRTETSGDDNEPSDSLKDGKFLD